VDPKDLDFAPGIDRGELITTATRASGTDSDGGYKRYKITESGIFNRGRFRAFLVTPTLPRRTNTKKTVSDQRRNSHTRRSAAP